MVGSACKDWNCKLITNRKEVLMRFREWQYTKLRRTNSIRFPQQWWVSLSSKSEVDFGHQRLENNNKAGSHYIAAELLKATRASLNSIFNYRQVPVLRKIHSSDLTSYRGISLFSVAYKIFSSIMSERLKPHFICIVDPYQWGFMFGNSSKEQIFLPSDR